MRDGILVIERMVLESLFKKEKNLVEMERDTGLDSGILKNILSNFMMDNLIKYQKGVYSLNKNEIMGKLKKINDKKQIKEEVCELFTSMINEYFKKIEQDQKNVDIKVRKIWLTPSEEKIFNTYLINLETFMKNIEQDRKIHPKNEKLKEKKVFIWGATDYSTIANGCLQAI
ncbi:MAG: hypothetical protein A2202_03015 [Bdellovibrionales bacterium RIFOXYA1_FULL_36_14]|nr:MAG: hypothetical protein A2202_03015 [Bdellovibrionales bacterium RIFOXYA1_FULL_36_14]